MATSSLTVGKILNEAQMSLSVHKKCVKLMVQRRSQDPESFLPELCNCILPVLLEYKVRSCACRRFTAAVLAFIRRRGGGEMHLRW